MRSHVLGQWGPGHTVAKVKATGLKLGAGLASGTHRPEYKATRVGCAPRDSARAVAFLLSFAAKAPASAGEGGLHLPQHPPSPTVGPCARAW